MAMMTADTRKSARMTKVSAILESLSTVEAETKGLIVTLAYRGKRLKRKLWKVAKWRQIICGERN